MTSKRNLWLTMLQAKWIYFLPSCKKCDEKCSAILSNGKREEIVAFEMERKTKLNASWDNFIILGHWKYYTIKVKWNYVETIKRNGRQPGPSTCGSKELMMTLHTINLQMKYIIPTK